MRASPPTRERGHLRTVVMIAAELLRRVGCAMVSAAVVAYGVAIFLGASFPTGVSHAENCPNAVYRTGPSAALPDCRAYELVTPPEKNGGYINEGYFGTSPEGTVATFTSNSGFAGASSNLNASTGYQANRAEGGWHTTAETQNEAEIIDYHGALLKDFSSESFGNLQTRGDSELESGVRAWLLQAPGRPESDLDLYLTRADGVNLAVGPVLPPTATGMAHQLQEEEEVHVLGMSADASHIVFEDPSPAGMNQWTFGAPGALLEYEYAGTGNSTPPMLVGVDDEGHFVDGCPSQLLGGTTRFTNLANPISTNGKTIFFTDHGSEPQCKGELFARIDNGEAGLEHTVAISEPTSEDCEKCDTDAAVQAPAEFLGASEDGSKVFFYTSQPLLNGEGGLYEYDFAAEGDKIVQIAPGNLPRVVEGAEGARVLVSQDGSHIYFLSEAVLTHEPSPDAQGDDAEGHAVPADAVSRPGAQNLYCFERDDDHPHGHVSFVADLKANNSELREFNWTPDGRFLVLNVQSELTRDDTSTNRQVFEYDAQAASLRRVSVGDNGYNDNGNGFDATIPSNRIAEPAFNPSSFLNNMAVSEDGAYVFFQSGDGLTPQAVNRVPVGSESIGKSVVPVYAQNIYEYHEGHVYLISDGQDLSAHVESQVNLLGTDLTGNDVFFETSDQLVGQDTDSNKDIYDARIEGGFPAPVRPVSCSGDACQGQLSPSPVLLSPGSEFQAGGNPTPAAPALAPAVVTSKPKALTNAQRLAVALKTCRRQPRKQQAKCVAAARKKYAPLEKSKKRSRK